MFDFAPLTRILIRYGLGYFAVKGLLPEGLLAMISDDPDVMAMADLAAVALAALVNEAWYSLAKKFGWAT